ncbi:uroporphyrinogen-III synthase [Pseudochelatococcus sp. G4_1912]|uniref:uroporphyrinogen-III synthase n=1 Tax=Pseudochelatococcus sp. G4_1912 TaxID=3114288 RepID=UPI0039C6CD29
MLTTGPRVLVMRPKSAGLRTAARLAAIGCEAVTAPILHIEPTEMSVPAGPFDAVSVTSAAALYRVAQLPNAMKALPLLAVGERTALLAQEAGFTDVHAAEGERHSLAALARQLFAGRARARLLLALGRDHKADTVALLEDAGIEPVTWIVYAAQAFETLPENAHMAIEAGQIDVVLHYSRRSATIACALVEQAGLWPAFARLTHCVLSKDVAAPLIERGVKSILTADRPHEDAMLTLFTTIGRSQGSP